MTPDRGSPVRLVDGLYAATARARVKARAEVRLALTIDGAMAGVARPVAFVSGFWRSGTTWLGESLAEALDAKTVFEPLSPLHPPRRAMLASRFGDDEDAAQAFIPGEADGPAAMRLLDRAMAGRGDSAFGLSCRTGVRESLRRRVVVKDVRAQALLAAIHARHRVPVVHLRRHPCAVVASLIRANWHWRFARVRLAAVVPHAALRNGGSIDAIEYDRDEVSRIAFAWALSERWAAAGLAGQRWGAIVAYEDLADDPHATFARLCSGLRLEPRRAIGFDVPSASIHPAEFATRAGQHDRWRDDLASEDAARVQRIATAVFPGWRETPSAGR